MSQRRRYFSAINAFDCSQFVEVFGGVFEHSPWIAEATWSQRPFTDTDSLHRALCETVARAGEEKQLDLIRAHPDLVGRAALAGSLTDTSKDEQASAGLDRLSAEDIAAFQSFNRKYREQFEFPFIICARLNKKEAILAAFPTRLKNTREQEIRAALAEIAKIARFRLEDRKSVV